LNFIYEIRFIRSQFKAGLSLEGAKSDI
jgi:hypothetical protein